MSLKKHRLDLVYFVLRASLELLERTPRIESIAKTARPQRGTRRSSCGSPPSLCALLADGGILKTGVGVVSDLARLEASLGLAACNGGVELSS